MNGLSQDWAFIFLIEDKLNTGDLVGQDGEALPSAASAIGTEASLYHEPQPQKFQRRLHAGLNGLLQFAGMYAGIAAKYACFCSLGKPMVVLEHFAAQSWEPLPSDFSVAEPISPESCSEGRGVAQKAWAIMQEEPKLLTYGGSG